jgi:hypothetical protein
MAQAPQPNIVNMTTAVLGMAQDSAASLQSYSTHQQGWNAELQNMGNLPIPAIGRQLANIQNTLTEMRQIDDAR